MYDNTALGLMQDDVMRIRKAAEYLEFHRKGMENN
jgi:hypothetical protein